MGDTATLDRDRLDRVVVPEETPEEAEVRRANLARRYAAAMIGSNPPQPAEPLATDCGCADHADDPDHEPCDACTASALGTTVVVVGDGAEPAPAAAPVDTAAAATDPAAAGADAGTSGDTVEIDPDNPGRFRAVLVTEGERTADDRIIDPGATGWRPVPLTMMCMVETAPGHMGARVAAVLESITREGNQIIGEGRFDTGEDGLNAARLVANGVLTGISVDPGDVTVETEVEETDEDGWPTKWLDHYTSMTLLGATICPFQAIGSAHIEYVSAVTASGAERGTMRPFVFGSLEWVAPEADDVALSEAEAALVAETGVDEMAAAALTAGIGLVFADEWFENPSLDYPTALHVDEDGRIRGHLAIWGECHIGFSGTCMLAPRSRTGYAGFLLGAINTEKGQRPVGSLTLGTVHAGQALGYAAALQHYEDTGLVAAWVNVGEDKHGIWVAGAMKPGLSDVTVTEFTTSKLSGDWREIRGNLELTAALGVNTPGYPVARIVNGRPTSLVAAIGPVRPNEPLAHAELRATRERLTNQAERLNALEARQERTEKRLQPIFAQHLAARLAT